MLLKVVEQSDGYSCSLSSELFVSLANFHSRFNVKFVFENCKKI